MADSIFTRALVQAVTIHGSTQAVASLLRVPENTLLRWMAGRAMMPVRAFKQLMEVLKSSDTHPIDAGGASPSGIFQFAFGAVAACCAKCNGTQFTSTVPTSTLRYRSPLTCVACQQTVILADLLAELADSYARFFSRQKSKGTTPAQRTPRP